MSRTPHTAAQNHMERISKIFHIHLNVLTEISNVKKESVSDVAAELVAIICVRQVSVSNVSRRLTALTETLHTIGEINTVDTAIFIIKTVLIFCKSFMFQI
jgi:hypothetical protein